ncbi:hypothetical protein GWI33_001115 [Rhynchophorus ferrugineus]|uniref:Uncharacterized protein n=1 Tax=Rhynchophorus ferrugineus TaxID=354439 RepID=A0A834HSI1_RHYFE|nr:hypothetical protein GWI33_001115 [Rhynchophorus ferrugineus]
MLVVRSGAEKIQPPLRKHAGQLIVERGYEPRIAGCAEGQVAGPHRREDPRAGSRWRHLAVDVGVVEMIVGRLSIRGAAAPPTPTNDP